MGISLVIPSAGHGSRFGSDLPKQLLPLAGRPLLLRSLDAFAGLVDEAILAVSADIHVAVSDMLSTYSSPMPVRLCLGGATRQDSVHAGLLQTNEIHDVVLIHDAVRPFVPRTCITDCIKALAIHDGAVVAIPCAATVKRSTSNTTVAETVARDDLWLAQTPQGGRRAALITAFAQARAHRWVCSDDAQVLERAGFTVALVRGDARNLKITTPDDWLLAEALLHSVSSS